MLAAQEQQPVTSSIVDRATIPWDFVRRLLDDILHCCDDVHLQAIDERGHPDHSAMAIIDNLKHASKGLECGLIPGIEVRYSFSGHLWRDRLFHGPMGYEFTRRREQDLA